MMSGVLTLQEYLLLNGADVDAKFSQIKADVRYFLEFCFCQYHCSRFS